MWTAAVSSAASCTCCGQAAGGRTARPSMSRSPRFMTATTGGVRRAAGTSCGRAQQRPGPSPTSPASTAPTSRPTAPQPGQKGGCDAGHRPVTWRTDQQDPRSGRRSRQADCLRPDARQHRRHQRRRDPARRHRAAAAPAGRRPMMPITCASGFKRSHRSGDPVQQHAAPSIPAQSHRLPQAQRHRTHVLPDEGLAPYCHSPRQARQRLPFRRRPRRSRLLLAHLIELNHVRHLLEILS